MRRKIVFKISIADAKISSDAQGFKGKSCIKETEKLLAGLNAKCQSRNFKPEYNYVETETGVGV
jgi:hypothetical protein